MMKHLARLERLEQRIVPTGGVAVLLPLDGGGWALVQCGRHSVHTDITDAKQNCAAKHTIIIDV